MKRASDTTKPGLVFIGLQGSGKGTQTEIFVERYGYQPVALGELLRDQVRKQTTIGQEIDQFLSSGTLVPDETIFSLIQHELATIPPGKSIIFDGFPRTAKQAELLSDLLLTLHRPPPIAIYLRIQESTVYARLSRRRICLRCRTIIAVTNTAAVASCPKCGGASEIRADDRPEVIARRLAIFHAETEPVVDFYTTRQRLFEIDAEQSIPDVTTQIEQKLGLTDNDIHKN